MHAIGQAARLAEVSVDTLRYYEKAGLIAPERRTAAGYRLYGEDTLRRLRFIRHAQGCGFTLAEIAGLLRVRGDDRACCGDVRRLATHKKLELEHKLRLLRAMSAALDRLIEDCEGGAQPLDECPILAALEAALPTQARA